MTETEFIALVLRNPVNAAILERLATLSLPDAWLVSGALFQTVWNVRTGREPTFGIRDYDIFYFDPDTSYDAEDAAIKRTRNTCADIPSVIEIRNQARVHLWYPAKFEMPYPVLKQTTDGIDLFLTPCAQVGLCRRKTGFEIYAPQGLDDIARMLVRPNPVPNFQAAPYWEKAQRWKSRWPELTIISP